MAYKRDTSGANQSRFNGPDCVFRFDARTLCAYRAVEAPTTATMTTRLTALGSCKLERGRDRCGASERDRAFSSSPKSSASSAASSSSTSASSSSPSSLSTSAAVSSDEECARSRVSDASSASYRLFSRRLRELIREQMEEYARRRRLRRARRSSCSSSSIAISRRPNVFATYRERDGGSSSDVDPMLEGIDVSRRNRAQLAVHYVGRCLARIDRRLRDILRDWKDRDSARYRALVRLKRTVRLMRVPLYVGMTLVGLYTSFAHLLAVEEHGALIFSATLYHLLNGSRTDV